MLRCLLKTPPTTHPYPDSVWSKQLIWCARRSIYDESIKFSPGHVRQELLDEAIPDFHGMAKGAAFAVSHLTGCQKSSWHTVWCGLLIGTFYGLHLSFGDVGDTWTLGFWTLLCVRKKLRGIWNHIPIGRMSGPLRCSLLAKLLRIIYTSINPCLDWRRWFLRTTTQPHPKTHPNSTHKSWN